MKTAKIIDFGERAFVVLLSLPFLITFARYIPTHPYAVCVAVGEMLSVLFILTRKPGEIAARPYPLIIAFLGTALPLLIRPGDAALLPSAVTSMAMLAGVIIGISAKLALNRSFGVVAANRGIKRGGPYRLVRHPMYLGYFITQLGFLLSAFSWLNLGIYLAAWSVQILRILAEEKLLMLDPNYRAFAKQVPRRVVPGF